VQDIATFATDIYMRGIDWTYVPTTLMAMADSCIGGKSSINVGKVKNVVGGLHPPVRVVVDPVFLPSLSPAARAAGLAEAAKIAYCRGGASFDGYLELLNRFDQDPTDLLLHVLSAKQWFIEVDEDDKKERRLLNFGHTFGHAIESAVEHTISHGAAVAVGILCALEHPLAADSPRAQALGQHCRQLLSEVDTLANSLDRFDRHTFERSFRSDKKHSIDSFRLILPVDGEGVAEIETGAGPREWTAILTATTSTIRSLGGRQA
jgi:3-dehydroquinate synthase